MKNGKGRRRKYRINYKSRAMRRYWANLSPEDRKKRIALLVEKQQEGRRKAMAERRKNYPQAVTVNIPDGTEPITASTTVGKEIVIRIMVN